MLVPAVRCVQRENGTGKTTEKEKISESSVRFCVDYGRYSLHF